MNPGLAGPYVLLSVALKGRGDSFQRYEHKVYQCLSVLEGGTKN